jgi:hypothetical protein
MCPPYTHVPHQALRQAVAVLRGEGFRICTQRPDFADRADDGGLAHAETARHEDLERDGLVRRPSALAAPEDHRFPSPA